MISKEELRQMKKTLSSNVIDDPEDILDWFGLNGIDMIDELLKLRKTFPELLEACREFVRFANLPKTVKRGDYIRYQVKAISAAKAAIAKVKGGKDD